MSTRLEEIKDAVEWAKRERDMSSLAASTAIFAGAREIAVANALHLSRLICCAEKCIAESETRELEAGRFSGKHRAIITALAESGMSVSEAARRLGMHRNTVAYNVERIKAITGKDPMNLFDLVELAKVAQGGKEDG